MEFPIHIALHIVAVVGGRGRIGVQCLVDDLGITNPVPQVRLVQGIRNGRIGLVIHGLGNLVPAVGGRVRLKITELIRPVFQYWLFGNCYLIR